MTKKIRCLLGMLGTDVHNKGIRVLSQILSDADIEVIYIGEHNTCEGMVARVVEEAPDIVGVSYSSSTYMDYTRELLLLMRERGVMHIPLMIGGLIHAEDHQALMDLGVKAIFGPGSRTPEMVAFVRQIKSHQRTIN